MYATYGSYASEVVCTCLRRTWMQSCTFNTYSSALCECRIHTYSLPQHYIVYTCIPVRIRGKLHTHAYVLRCIQWYAAYKSIHSPDAFRTCCIHAHTPAYELLHSLSVAFRGGHCWRRHWMHSNAAYLRMRHVTNTSESNRRRMQPRRMYTNATSQHYCMHLNVFECKLSSECINVDALECNLGKKLHVFG